MWHVMIVWGHGLSEYDSILDAVLNTLSPPVRVHFQTTHTVDSIVNFINEVYREDVARIGASHLEAKIQYLQTTGNKISIIVLFDPNPDIVDYGGGKWKSRQNRRIVDLKRNIRQQFNPNPKRKTRRDCNGMFSRHHVVHVSDTEGDVDSILQYLKLPTKTSLHNKSLLKRRRKFIENGYFVQRAAVEPHLVQSIQSAITEHLPENASSTTKSVTNSFAPSLLKSTLITSLLHQVDVAATVDDIIGIQNICGIPRAQIAVVSRSSSSSSSRSSVRPAAATLKWHVDGMNRYALGRFSLLLGIVITDCSLSGSGGLVVWPSSHRQVANYFRRRSSASSSSSNEDVQTFCDQPPTLDSTPVELLARPGDLIVCHYSLAHSKSLNVNMNAPYHRQIVYFRLRHVANDPHSLSNLYDGWNVNVAPSHSLHYSASSLRMAINSCTRTCTRERCATMTSAIVYNWLKEFYSPDEFKRIFFSETLHLMIRNHVDILLPSLRVLAKLTNKKLIELDLLYETFHLSVMEKKDLERMADTVRQMVGSTATPTMMVASTPLTRTIVELAFSGDEEKKRCSPPHMSFIFLYSPEESLPSSKENIFWSPFNVLECPTMDARLHYDLHCWCARFFHSLRSKTKSTKTTLTSIEQVYIHNVTHENENTACNITTAASVHDTNRVGIHASTSLVSTGCGLYYRYMLSNERDYFYNVDCLPTFQRDLLEQCSIKAGFPCFKKYVFHWQQKNHVTPLWVDIGGLVKPLVQELYLHCTAHYICLGVVPVEMIHNEKRNHSRFIISGTTLNQILRDNNYSKMFQRPLLYHSLVMQRASRVLHKK